MKKRILSAVLALVMLMTLVVSMPVKAEAYELTVNNIHWGTGDSDRILSWDPVEGATRYYVSCGSGGGNAGNNTSKDLAYCITQSGTYTPTVTAYNGDVQITEETTGPSKDFVVTPLETPTNVVVDFDNGTITWNPVANATQYYVGLFSYKESDGYDCAYNYETSVYSNTPSVALSKFTSSLTDGNDYYFGIRAYDRTYNYGDSAFGHSEKFTYTAPVMTTVQNIQWGTGENEKVLTWDPVAGATRYYVSCGSGGGYADTTSKSLAFTITQSGTYTPTVTAYNGDVQISEKTTGPSKDFVVMPLDAPTNVVADIESGTVTWNPVANATKYYVALYGYNDSYGYDCRSCYETSVYSNTPSVALSSFASRLTEGQEYYFGIRAYDDTYYYGYSDFGHSEKFTYVTKYDVTTSVFATGGTISPSQRIEKGGDVTITLTPDAGYYVSYLQVNGVDVTSSMVGNTYTISNVQGNKTVVAQFALCHHEWGTGTVTKEATCKETGTREYTCPICHDTKQETIAKLTTHTWDGGVVTKAPTCKDTGIMTYTCTVCEMTKTEIVGATGVHTYGEYTTTTEPTCTGTGIETRYCTVCNAKDEKTIPATGHTEQAVEAIAPTCTEDGKTAGTICSVCKVVLSGCEDDPAPGHTVVTDKAVAATYAKTGKTAGTHCSVCNKVLTAQKAVAMKKLSQAKITSITNTKDGITVKWGKVTGATAYQVYRRVGSGSWKLWKTTTSTSVSNSSLTNGTKYQYKVRAIVKNSAGKVVNTGAYSVIKTMYRLTRPTISSATNSGAGKITVKWNKNTKVTGYQVKYIKGTTAKTVTVKGASSLTKTLSKLTKGATYKVYVRSYKTVSGTNYYSAWSAYKSVKVKATTTSAKTAATGVIVTGSAASVNITSGYVLNTNSMKYHRPTCSSAKQISAQNLGTFDGSAAKLRSMGYEPCKRCNP